MFNFLKKKSDNKASGADQQPKASWLQRLRHLFKQPDTLSDDYLQELETSLLIADVGVETTQYIIERLKKEKGELKKIMSDILTPCEQALIISEQHKPFVILMIGINGAGKTTTIGKLTKQLQAQGKSVMLAAGDTFRVAAVQQLQAWGEKNNVPVIMQQQGADSASVIYDAVQSATAKKIDVLIADTAGRLHTQQGLMAELAKVKRVIQKLDASAPHETMLVLDASIGQNALQQAKQFHEAIGLTGITMTKLDGTAKGGILFAIAQQLNLPLRFIGTGEAIDDLQPFSAHDFIDAIFYDENNNGEQHEGP
jgi:fused signal recognition particle receptor